MNQLTIIATDGERTALIMDGKVFMGVDHLSFKASSGASPELTVRVARLYDHVQPVSRRMVEEAVAQLGFKLSDE